MVLEFSINEPSKIKQVNWEDQKISCRNEDICRDR